MNEDAFVKILLADLAFNSRSLIEFIEGKMPSDKVCNSMWRGTFDNPDPQPNTPMYATGLLARCDFLISDLGVYITKDTIFDIHTSLGRPTYVISYTYEGKKVIWSKNKAGNKT